MELHANNGIACDGCPFQTAVVGSKGSPESPYVLVAESPGREELREGIPLVGPSGRLFHRFIREDALYVLNAIQCAPPKGKSSKAIDVAARACNSRLLEHIKAHPRRLIIAMGNAAVRSLTGDYTHKITQIRGSILKSDLAEVGILPVLHIAAIMRGTGSFKEWRLDIQRAIDLMDGAKSQNKHIKANVIHIKDATTLANIFNLFDDSDITGKPFTVTCDIETSSLDYVSGRVLSLGFTFHNDFQTSYYVRPEQISMLKPYLEDPTIKWNWHNGKFDVQWLRAQYCIEARVDEDTMLCSYSLDENSGVHDLENVSKNILNAPDYKHMIRPWVKTSKDSYEKVPFDVLVEYQGIDTSNTAQILAPQRSSMDVEGTTQLYESLLIPASEFLTQVELTGFYVDKERLEANRVQYDELHCQQLDELWELVGEDFNVNSPKQLLHILNNVVGFRRIHSTAKDELHDLRLLTLRRGVSDGLSDEEITRRLRILELIVDARHTQKLLGTYIVGMERHIRLDGRIHPTYLIHGTRTGRLSCRNPNLQNIPRDSTIRQQFCSGISRKLIEIDLAQAELRTLACLSEDINLIDAFNSGNDPHLDLCLALWGNEWPTLTATERKEKRVLAKNVNFGIMYGITEFGLAMQTRETPQVCRDRLATWHERYPEASSFLHRCRSTVSDSVEMTTPFGRKKRPTIVTHANKAFLENEAANFGCQSIASDITLSAGINTWRRLKALDTKIVNIVHDSLVLEAPDSPHLDIMEPIEIVREEFRTVARRAGLHHVVFESDAEVGTHWGKLEQIT